MDRLRYANTARALVAASALAALAFMALVVRPAPAAMANHVPYSRGDVFAAVGYGLIKHFDSSGTLLETLNTSSNSHFGGGMCFDGSGNLFAVNFTDSSISMFNTQGGLLVHPWVANIHLRPESCVFDSTGNMYVGVADGNRQLLKFDPYGNQLAGYSPAVERRGVDWIDLAADQCTMFYTSEGSLVKRFNICTNTQLPDFATGLQLPCYALSIRPNGEVMVACSTRAYRLSSTGTILQEYPRDSFGETGELFSLNLDPDGTSFWVGGPNSIYRIDIATGNLLTSFQSDPFTSLGGLAIFGEFRAAQPTATATVTGTPPTPLPTATRTNTPTPTNTPDPCITGSRYAIATSTATMIPGTDDIGNSCQDCITTIALPFPFQLYGVTYNSANVSTNGNIQFTTTNIDWQNVCLPAASFGPTIFAHWDNLNTVPHANCAGYPGGVCGIFTTVSGSAPNRTFVIEWRTIYQYLGAPPVNFEVLLHEGRSDFDVVYGTVPEIGLSSTEGVQRYFGLDGFTQYACNAAASLTNGLKLTYQYVTCPPTATSTPTRTPVPPTPVPTPPACGYTVLIVHGDPLYPPQTLRNQILALPDMARVDLFDGHNGTPSLDLMRNYHIVVPMSNNVFQNPTLLGDNLADYLDTNGIVVAHNYSWLSYWAIHGRWETGGYSPYLFTNADYTADATLGAHNPDHPLMQGVSNLFARGRSVNQLALQAERVAQWSDGQEAIAVKARAVGVNAYVGDYPAGGTNWSGDFAKIIANAGRWLSPQQVCATPGSTSTATPTSIPTASATPVPTYTHTSVPPTGTSTAVPTNTATRTPTATLIPTGTPTSTPTATPTHTPSPTPTNSPPVVGNITAPLDPIAVGTPAIASAPFTDADTADTHTALWDWGDGTTSPGTVTESNGSGSVTGSHTYTGPGVYALRLTVTDNHGGAGSATYRYVVVYDPQGQFVTGGGWITSPPGAYVPDPTLTGRANFGFVSRYRPGRPVPDGSTEFQFQVANMNFHSEVYEWLVVSGPRAQYRGWGTVNGAGEYGFMLTAIDGQVSGGGGTDKFRMKIWDRATSAVIYDNQLGAPDDVDPTTIIGGGSIVIHR